MKRLSLLLCVVFLLVDGISTTTVKAQTIKIGIADWPPYVEKEHIAFGLIPEIVQLAFLQQDLVVDFVVFDNWADCTAALKSAVIDASVPYTSTEARRTTMLFSKHPIIELTTAVFCLRDTAERIPDTNLFADQKAFSGLVIGGTRGYYYEDLLKNANIIYTAKPYVNFQKLYLGKVDLVIENELIGWHTLSQLFPYSLSQFYELRNSKETHGAHLVVNKDNPIGPRLLQTFDKGLDALQQNGTYTEMIQKYKEIFKRKL